jgi:hypothetical protein
MKIRFPILLPVMSLALLLGGCVNNTKVEKTWVSPDIGKAKFSKVVVLALATDDINRRMAEVPVKRGIERVPAIGSYEILPDVTDIRDKEKVIKAVTESGADGVIVLRMLYSDTDVDYGASVAKPMEYQIFSDLYGTAYDVGAYYAMDRRDVATTRIFAIETRIYDVKTQKLLWMGQTQSSRSMTKDHDSEGLMNEVADKVRATLRSQNILK